MLAAGVAQADEVEAGEQGLAVAEQEGEMAR